MKKYNHDSFIKEAKRIHKDKYDYSKTVYTDWGCTIIIICPEHGEFEKIASNHLKQGCPKCSKKYRRTQEDFINEANQIHDGKYDYSYSIFTTISKHIEIICLEHGPFFQSPKNHLKGKGCPSCSGKEKLDTKTFIEKSKEIHKNRYDYSETIYTKKKEKVRIICPEHGLFYKEASSHLKGKGCPKCSLSNSKTSFTKEEYIKKASEVHDFVYDYSVTEYTNMKTKIDIICKEHGLFTQSPESHLRGFGCPKCSDYKTTSKAEEELCNYIEALGFDYRSNDRQLLDGKEIDIYIPNLNLGIEYHGLYWHSSKFIDKNYHKDKLELAEKKNIRLIQIFEDEWINKKDIILKKISLLCGIKEKRIYARKTKVSKVSNKDVKDFYELNHIQGHVDASLVYILSYNNKIVASMSFKKRKTSYELTRYATSCNVIGGFSKLLKAFIKENPEAKEIISFADLRWSLGDVYLKNGFKKLYRTKPNYTYREGCFRVRKELYRHKYLKKKLKRYDPNKSELENTLDNKLYRIYDCGLIKFIYETD